MIPRFHIALDGQAAVDQERGGGRRKAGGEKKGKILGLGSEVIQSVGKQKVPRRKKLPWGQRSKKGGQRSKKLGSEVMFVNVKVVDSGYRLQPGR